MRHLAALACDCVLATNCSHSVRRAGRRYLPRTGGYLNRHTAAWAHFCETRMLRATASYAFDVLHRLRGRKNRDASVVAAQAVQITVAGDDEIGLPGESTGEHLVIVGILRDDARHILWSGHIGHTAKLYDDTLWY